MKIIIGAILLSLIVALGYIILGKNMNKVGEEMERIDNEMKKDGK